MIGMSDVSSYFSNLSRTMNKLPVGIIDQIAQTILHAYDRGHMIYFFGNGGSAALASHLACDLGKGTVNGNSKRFRVLALTDNVPLMTAWANDSKYEDIFAEQLSNLVRCDDVAFAISGSGNSPNILRALKVARQAGAITVGFTGFLLMVPLAITSTPGWIRRMGGKNWLLLHRAIYISAIAGVIHYAWLVKSDERKPIQYGVLVGLLLLWRLGVWLARRKRRAAGSVAARSEPVTVETAETA